jgi:Tfp pilus assembly pilus retraction ATPase PilT
MKGMGASDLHMKAGMRPFYRIGGHLRALNAFEGFAKDQHKNYPGTDLYEAFLQLPTNHETIATTVGMRSAK